MAPAPASLWLDGAEAPAHPALEADLNVEVAVLGGGIAGLTTAVLLRQAGWSVAVLEAERVGHGVTGYTTAKVSSLHGTIYSRLASSFGEDGARVYGEANEAGIAKLRELAEGLAIDCDLETRDAFTYAESENDLDKLRDEVEAATRAGLPAALLLGSGELPFEVAGAVRFSDQAQFHPVKYLHGLARTIAGEGGHVLEHTRATDVKEGDPCRVETAGGHTVFADNVVVATHFPFLDRGLFFARMHPERSYVVAARVKGPAPRGMYLSTESPAHSIRSHPAAGGELVLIGGESHKVGQSETSERYAALERWARERFDVASIEYRWATQDNMPVDGLPYVGRLQPFSSRVHVATGFAKWGLANGTAAAMMLSDAILGRRNPWAATFDPNRLKPLASASELLKENVNVARRFVGDRLRHPDSVRLEQLEPGQGGVVKLDGEKLAAYRDDDGRLHAVSPACTHLGCHVTWNSAERTWDCPCHGSRFAPGGEVIQGPAVEPLEARQVPAR